ncbi:MAG: thioredoxin family protein [Paludibacteraceae bacterium]|nr:thioredoxin family protein [Paludibacteraceae bacterium]
MAKVITDDTFTSELNENKVMVVEIGAPGCGPCKALSKTMEEIEPSYAGKVAFFNGDMGSGDVDDLCMEYYVMSAPTLLFFKDGELSEKMIGAAKKADIEAKLNSLI